MAGRGSRFAATGELLPKPLIDLGGRPFFQWAAESVLRQVAVRQKIFVVLEEHVASHDLENRIRAYYPDATVVAIPEPTAGAAETAVAGLAALDCDGPIAINDCDHGFLAPSLSELVRQLGAGAAGGLVGFPSNDPAYSYVRLAEDDATRVVETVEKQCVGPYAIAGCYLFRDSATVTRSFARYRAECPYAELYLSGLYNLLAESGETVRFQLLDQHFSFGTPKELACLPRTALDILSGQVECI
jgi:dTDP-glucose pyrophosphorylase